MCHFTALILVAKIMYRIFKQFLLAVLLTCSQHGPVTMFARWTRSQKDILLVSKNSLDNQRSTDCNTGSNLPCQKLWGFFFGGGAHFLPDIFLLQHCGLVGSMAKSLMTAALNIVMPWQLHTIKGAILACENDPRDKEVKVEWFSLKTALMWHQHSQVLWSNCAGYLQ